MRRKKIGGTPKKLFKTEIQVYTQLLKKIENGRNLTDIEFSICSEELRKIYLVTKADKCDLDDWLLEFCDDTIITRLVTKAIERDGKLSKLAFNKISDEELLQRYLILKLNNGELQDWELEKFDKEKVKIFWQNKLDSDDIENIYLDTCEFNLLDEEYKILYIFNHGLINIEDEIIDWFNIWKKAKGRNIRIEQILAD
jgi:hypothetical protein